MVLFYRGLKNPGLTEVGRVLEIPLARQGDVSADTFES